MPITRERRSPLAFDALPSSRDLRDPNGIRTRFEAFATLRDFDIILRDPTL